jgi:hypothetical protein
VLIAQDSAQDIIIEKSPNESAYRLKYSIVIHSADEFIQFLKTHQFEGDGVAKTPTKDKLFPSHAMWWSGSSEDVDKFKIDLDKFKSKVEVSTDGGTKYYKLDLQPDDFSNSARDILDATAFSLTIVMSDKGDVTIRHHMGI